MSSLLAQPSFELSHPLTGSGSLPRELRDFRGYHAGETILVCGCGSSLPEIVSPERYITIGVNDVGRLFQPDYLVVLNPRQQFHGGRFQFVEESRARAIFTQLELGIRHSHIVRFRLGKFAGVDFSDPTTLNYTRNSPYLALCLAIHLGARKIGLIGVDFTDHHFFGATGRHALASTFAQIDREYRVLYDACTRRGIELVNLSHQSRLSALPKVSPLDFARAAVTPKPADSLGSRRIFFVNYKFLSCGDVFRDGLTNAAADLGLIHEGAYWDDARLREKVRKFAPDLLLVVHGRRFSQRWKNEFAGIRSAVWLLDEPYEVDDTAKFSGLFDTVFVNDPATLHRHRNAHYLPVCYDPARYFYRPGIVRNNAVGFIGGFNALREEFLEALARSGLLTYVVGGPWRKPCVQALNLHNNIAAEKTGELYRDTKIVLNVFRTEFHFNRLSHLATSLNPRIYEAVACGGLVISQNRPEIGEICPELPVFSSAEDLILQIEELSRDKARFDNLRTACIRRLAQHTYADRLHTAVKLIIEKEPIMKPVMGPAPPAPAKTCEPGCSILMAVHNALAMTQLSTLTTLRNIEGQDATLIVVDNASNDGAEEWLKMLAERGDIRLISNSSNLGHGPALEQARRATRSRYIVSLDSDSYPLASDWLDRLRERLTGNVKVSGIRHHRNYIHPSCLMVERKTIDELGVSFLDEKGRSSRFDVAERISHEVKRHGYEISGLEQTKSLRRASASEPVDLGAEYSGIVHHQWYTTRAATSGGRPVDDVPNEAIERSLQEVFEDYHAEPRELAVIVSLRANLQADRLRNAKACLRALNVQDLERWRYRIIAVEQDSEPRLESALAPFVDRYILAYNPGPFNRGWGFNVGARVAAAERALCLIDADLLTPPTFLRTALERFLQGQRALRPYTEVMYLDSTSTERAIATRQAQPMSSFSLDSYKGQLFQDSEGACTWVDPQLYEEIQGHDERFRGWGWEDREFCRRLGRMTAIEILPGRLAHLDHARPDMSDRWANANADLCRKIASGKVPPWHGPMGGVRYYADEKPDPVEGPATCGAREWENWHQWPAHRIERIVADEARKSTNISARWCLAQILLSQGQTLLDVGCGPGAMWVHLEPHRDRISWTGIDATPHMLEVARRRFPSVPLVHGDSAALPFDAGAFDVVLMRHVLEHQPPGLMERSLAEAMRVAKRAVVLDFFVPPTAHGPRATSRVGEGFLEICWTENEIKAPFTKGGWGLKARFNISGTADERDQVWIFAPQENAVPVPESTGASSQDNLTKVSIVMPTYRRCHAIVHTLQTIWAQSYRNWELILVDNAGDAGYWFADPRIRLYRYIDRPSASYARNEALKHVTGELVIFFDDDDDMFPNYLERFVTAFRANPNAKMVRCGMLVSAGKTDFSYATPECCLRAQYATPTWNGQSFVHDQDYFKSIASARHWSAQKGDILVLREALCRANRNPRGGLRVGRL
jgi:glycosyltransferase involved in cell wall biosynthesis